jgi:hypothetical protein
MTRLPDMTPKSNMSDFFNKDFRYFLVNLPPA